MIVYGKTTSRQPTDDALRQLATLFQAVAGCKGAGREAREAFLLSTGAVTQALLDLELERAGMDVDSPLSRRCGALLRAAGDLFAQGDGSALRHAEASLRGLTELVREAPDLQTVLALREPEGFAFYAVSPRQYVSAAQQLKRALSRLRGDGSARNAQVIGIRSIGTALAPVVASALGSALPLWTLRPRGHPFARHVELAPRLARALLAGLEEKTYVVVDEGPGLSGSSLLSVLTWLEAQGVARDRVWLLPSHDGQPGFASSARGRADYARAAKVCASFERVFLDAGSPTCLNQLFSDRVGPAILPLTDLGGGKWRPLLFASERDYPACHPQQERRKYLLQTARGRFLLKFQGLGARALRLRERSRTLAQEGYGPALLEVRDGFGLMRWHEGARPLTWDVGERTELLAHVAHYVTFVARAFGGQPSWSGARPSELAGMLRHNVSELLDPDHAELCDKLWAWLPELESSHRTTATDNRMDPHEWLETPQGILKTDALDHHASHDCIGCQDPTWDVVGACVELGFSSAERARLVAHLPRDLRPTPRQWLFYELSYLAFRAGSHALAKRGLDATWPEESARIERALRRYRSALADELAVLERAAPAPECRL